MRYGRSSNNCVHTRGSDKSTPPPPYSPRQQKVDLRGGGAVGGGIDSDRCTVNRINQQQPQRRRSIDTVIHTQQLHKSRRSTVGNMTSTLMNSSSVRHSHRRTVKNSIGSASHSMQMQPSSSASAHTPTSSTASETCSSDETSDRSFNYVIDRGIAISVQRQHEHQQQSNGVAVRGESTIGRNQQTHTLQRQQPIQQKWRSIGSRRRQSNERDVHKSEQEVEHKGRGRSIIRGIPTTRFEGRSLSRIRSSASSSVREMHGNAFNNVDKGVVSSDVAGRGGSNGDSVGRSRSLGRAQRDENMLPRRQTSHQQYDSTRLPSSQYRQEHRTPSKQGTRMRTSQSFNNFQAAVPSQTMYRTNSSPRARDGSQSHCKEPRLPQAKGRGVPSCPVDYTIYLDTPPIKCRDPQSQYPKSPTRHEVHDDLSTHEVPRRKGSTPLSESAIRRSNTSTSRSSSQRAVYTRRQSLPSDNLRASAISSSSCYSRQQSLPDGRGVVSLSTAMKTNSTSSGNNSIKNTMNGASPNVSHNNNVRQHRLPVLKLEPSEVPPRRKNSLPMDTTKASSKSIGNVYRPRRQSLDGEQPSKLNLPEETESAAFAIKAPAPESQLQTDTIQRRFDGGSPCVDRDQIKPHPRRQKTGDASSRSSSTRFDPFGVHRNRYYMNHGPQAEMLLREDNKPSLKDSISADVVEVDGLNGGIHEQESVQQLTSSSRSCSNSSHYFPVSVPTLLEKKIESTSRGTLVSFSKADTYDECTTCSGSTRKCRPNSSSTVQSKAKLQTDHPLRSYDEILSFIRGQTS